MEDRDKKIYAAPILVAVLCLAIAVLTGVFGIYFARQAHAERMSAIENEIEAAGRRVDNADNDATVYKAGDGLKSVFDAAEDASKTVVAAQNEESAVENKYILMDSGYTPEDIKEDIEPSQKILRSYFGEKTSYAARWYTGSPRVIEYEWKYVVPRQIVEGNVPLIWMCYAKDTGELLAYVTGVYRVSDGMIVNTDRFVTPYGSKQTGLTYDTSRTNLGFTEADKAYGQRIMDMIGNIHVEHEVELPEYDEEQTEQLRENKASRMQLRDEMTGGGTDSDTEGE